MKVKRVFVNNDYTLFVELANGRSGILDVKPYLEKGVFKQLKDKNYFKQVKPFLCGIAWPDEQELNADTIAYEMKQLKSHNK